MKTTLIKSSLILAAAMIAAAPGAVYAIAANATDNWTGTAGDGKFNTVGNWSTGAVPGSSDVAVFGLGATSTYTVTLGSASYSSQMVVDNNSLTIANGGYSYTLSSTGAMGSGDESLIVGNGAGNTAANLTLGTSYPPVSGVSATIGEVNGSVGTLTIGTAGNPYGNNALQLSGALAVGYGGNGTLTINAGSADVGGDLDIAALSGSIGKVDIELTSAGGCSFGPTPLKVGGNLYVGGSAAGAGGTGTLLINGTNGQYGSASYGVQVTGTATIYSGASVTLKSGLLEAASISNAGSLNFNGGTLDLTNSGMTVGSAGLLGANVALGSGKTLQISGTTTVAAGGALTISGGELDTGTLSSGGGSISFTSGTLGITNSDLIIDTGGPLGNNVSLASGQTLNVKNNNLIVGNTGAGTLAVGSGAYVNANQLFIAAQRGSHGSVTVNGTLGGGGSIFVGGNATRAGGTGTLTVNSGANMYVGTTVRRGGTLVDNAAGTLNYSSISIQSGGVMDTTGSSQIDASSVTNAGLIEVQSGSLGFGGSGPLTNTGGTIKSDNGTTVQLYAATISGGTLTGSGTGNFVSESATLDGTPTGGLTNNATMNVNDSGSPSSGYSLTLQGTIVNNGQINITSTGDDTWLYINGPTTISGTGTITLADNGGNTAFLAGAPTGSNDSLSNAGTIQGSGTVGNSSSSNNLQSFTNSGTINADVSAKTLVLGGYKLTNTGALEATNGGTLLFNRGAIINNAGGTISASGANSVVSLISADIQGGTLNASGGGQLDLFGSGTYQTTTLDGSSSEVILGSDMTVSTSNTLVISGNVQNNGNLTVQGPSGGLVAATLYFKGATTISGTGAVIMSSGSYIQGYNSSSTLTNQSTIAGAGAISGLMLNNSGTINANVSGKELSIDSNAVTNTGLFEATNGGIIYSEGGPVANTGGTILAGGAGSIAYLSSGTQGGTISASGGGAVDLADGTVQGGTLTTDAQSTIYAGSGTLDGSSNPVTNSGNLQAANTGPHPGDLTLKGTIDNTGSITIHSGAYLYISGSVTLNGGGILQLNNTNNYPAVLQGADYQGGDSLTNNSTIQGAGTIGDPNGNYTVALTNTGTIDANVNGETLNVWGAVTNTGNLEATNGGTLYMHAAYTQNNGTTYFGAGGAGAGGGGGGGVQFGGGFNMNGGYGYGGGYYYGGGDFYNSGGSFSPGNPQTGGGLSCVGGTFTITHNYSASGGASTNFHIGGTGQGLSNGYDYLKVGGAFSAGGQLGIQFVNNFQSSITAADTFDIITGTGGITGGFSNAVSGGTVETTDGFGSFHVNYGTGAASPNDVILSNFSFTPGGGGSAGTAKVGTPSGNGGESFNNTYSGGWVDPSGQTLVYTMTSSSLFTKIDAFRPGYHGLTITVDGTTYTGFGGDNGYTNTFDFTGLPGGGATTFSIGDIATNLSNPFAVQLEFSTPTASFTVTPASTPEPTTWLLLALGSAALALYPRRRQLR